MWNLNKKNNSPFLLAFQHKMSDYKTPTDRQFYYDSQGNIVWEPAGHTGAWATKHPIHEFRLLGHGTSRDLSWTLGLAAGRMLATSGLAYSNTVTFDKAITDFYSIEGKLDLPSWSVWSNFGRGMWGPEPYQAFFGETFDRLWALGVSYKITVNTTVDVSYLGAREDNNSFVPPDLGSYDEIRTVFSHRFGFIFQFEEAKSGYEAR